MRSPRARRRSRAGSSTCRSSPDISGAAMLVKTEAFQRVGLLTEDYFLYFEELDFIHRLGGRERMGWEPGSVVFHKGGASTGGVGQQRSVVSEYYQNLSALKFTTRFYRHYLPVVLLSRLLLKPLLFAWRAEWHLFKPFSQAIGHYSLWLLRNKAG